MEIKFFNSQCVKCEDCLFKDSCVSLIRNRNNQNNINTCDICTKRCTKYRIPEREWKETCSTRHCMFEVDTEKARERL